MGPIRGPWTDIVEGVRRIKAKDGPDLIVWGSSTLNIDAARTWAC
jgi:hypothetical protein